MGDTLKAGESLRVGQELRSANGMYQLILQGDGNLVLYEPGGPVWATDTWTLPQLLRPTRLDMQTDGNVVLYNDFNYVGWSPNIYGKGGDRLVVQDDRNVVVYTSSGAPVWATDTWVRPAPRPMGEIVHRDTAEVGWGKKMDTEAKLFSDGTLLVSTKSSCMAPFSGLKGRVLVVAIDAQSRVIWASQTLYCQTMCALFDPSCPSVGTDTFQEKWPEKIGELAVRLDVFQSDNAIYDRMRQAIRETLEFINEIKDVLPFWK
jgi:hypothetical protein